MKIQEQAISGYRAGVRVRIPFEDGSQITVTGLSDVEVRTMADDFEARGHRVERTPPSGLVC